MRGRKNRQRLSISVTVPTGTDHLKLYCSLRYASGTAWFDGMQLEEGDSANDLNILQNADFSSGGSWLDENGNAAAIQDGAAVIGGTAGAYDDAQEDIIEETTVEETAPETTEVTEYVTSPNDTVITYDCNGLRTQKGGTHYYYDSDNNLIAMYDGIHTLLFYYDENGNATSFSRKRQMR